MNQCAEIQCADGTDVLGYFREKLSGMKSPTAVAYRKAAASLDSFLLDNNLGFSNPSAALLADWYMHMLLSGLSMKTASYYLNNVCSLYNTAVKDGVTAPCGSFKAVKGRIKQLPAEPRTITAQSFGNLLQLHSRLGRQPGSISLFADIILFSLLNGGMPVEKIAMLRKDDLAGYDDDSVDVAMRHADPRRRYVFPLGQGMHTRRRLLRHVEDNVAAILRLMDVVQTGTVDATLRGYWAYGALRCGATASVVAGCTGSVVDGIPALALAEPANVTPDEKSALEHSVARMFVSDPLRWYAMRLRPGVKYDDVKKRLAMQAGGASAPELFYPCEEIVKRIGRRLVHEQRPFIADVLFFRSRVSRVQPMFRNIGDLAWCYRHDGSYAAISDAEMYAFQRTIRYLSPAISPAAHDDLAVGSLVRITGGPCAGYVGKIYEIKDGGDDRILTLNLLGLEFLSWRERIESRYVEPLQ